MIVRGVLVDWRGTLVVSPARFARTPDAPGIPPSEALRVGDRPRAERRLHRVAALACSGDAGISHTR